MATRKTKIRYIKAYDYKVSLANGFYGGFNTNGLFNLNFYTDRVVIPDSEEVEFDENNKKIGSTFEKDGDSVREVQFGAVIDLKTAKMVADWLNRKVKEYEETKK